ncbi:hypothetical protein AVEN_222088-1 [Araneus ventricosus]|uniref:CCHC-type domain-containing protein n=1 Tax=Araneus ventricosus TaxID=182803 RepID=A0A4Y2DX33_ARAVE|nr:hypothetical protein AVEN_222088-1 [Araneus ventricosus]
MPTIHKHLDLSDFISEEMTEQEIESSIQIVSAYSLSEPSPNEVIPQVSVAATTKIRAVLGKARTSKHNRQLLIAELTTLLSYMYDQVAEIGSLKAQVSLLQQENMLSSGLKEQVALLQAENAVLQRSAQAQGPSAPIQGQAPQQAPKTYSEILKEKAKKRPPPRHVSLVYPRSEEVKESLLKKVDLSKAQLGIKNMRKISKGGIAIECRSNKDLEKLLLEINSNPKVSPTLEARIPARKLPRIILYDVDKTVSKEDLLEKIVAQNDLNQQAIKILFSLNGRARDKCHWVLEAQPSEFKKILKKGKMSFEWSRLSLREFVRPIRCYKRNQYGHISTKYEGKETCPRCGEEWHKGPECEKEKKCSACTAANGKLKKGYDTGHAATDSDCPTYWHELAELKKRIYYGP